VVGSPNPAHATASGLDAVVALASNDVWAVGGAVFGSAPGMPEATLTEHWDGSAWTIVPSPNPAAYSTLWGVARAGSSSGLWAVGSYTKASGTIPLHTLIERWDGTSWGVVDSPSAPNGSELLAVAPADASGHAWAVGDWCCAAADGSLQPLTEYWDGSSWRVVRAPSGGEGSRLDAVTLVPGSIRAWAVGFGGSPYEHGFSDSWNGSAWSLVPTQIPAQSENEVLYDVTAVAGNDVWAVGDYEYTGPGGPAWDTLTERWNGSGWTVVSSPNVDLSNFLKSVARIPGTAELWAVGYHYAPPARTLIERYA